MGFLTNFFELLKVGGLPFLFLLVLIEGNPILGSFIPGQVLVIFVGFLISTTQIFNLKITILIVFFGALIGDIIGYYMGRHYGVKGMKTFGLDENSSIYKSSYNFFKKYGSWSIILGREFNFTRAFMPFFAGCFKMKRKVFFVFAVLSNIIWTLLSVALGYYFGFVIIDNFKFIMEFMFFLFLYLVGTIFVYKNVKTFYVENIEMFRKYSVHNWFFLGFMFAILLIMLFVIRWNFVQIFNDYFSFLYFPSFSLFFGFLSTRSFVGLFLVFLFFLFLISKNVRILIVYFWSLVLFLFFSMAIGAFLNLKFGFYPYFSLILFTILIFYFWIFLKKYQMKLGTSYNYFNFSLILFLILNFLTLFSKTGNLFIIFLSFIIGVIQTELILLLSHYSILDNVLSKIRLPKKDIN